MARDLGLTESAVRNWVVPQESAAGGGQGATLSTTERAELTPLRREVRLLRMAREGLKKATLFFAREST